MNMEKKYRVLVVDDSSFMRKAIQEILEADEEIKVVGSAENGIMCLDMIREFRPDVITLDMDMPFMDGMTAIRRIMVEDPVPIVVLSSLYGKGSITFEALRLGVIDFVPKPSGAISEDIHTEDQEIRNRIKLATSVNLENIRRVRMTEQTRLPHADNRGAPPEHIIAVGTSISGPNTFIRLLSTLSPDLPAAVVIVLDIDPKILPSFTEKFDEEVPWKVETVASGIKLKQGTCYIHPYSSTIRIKDDKNDEPCIQIYGAGKNPLNRLFSSAADTFGQYCLGVLLTGIGDDGAEGFARIREMKGMTVAQSVETCVYPNLTDNVIKNNLVDQVVDEKQLATEIEKILIRSSKLQQG